MKPTHIIFSVPRFGFAYGNDFVTSSKCSWYAESLAEGHSVANCLVQQRLGVKCYRGSVAGNEVLSVMKLVCRARGHWQVIPNAMHFNFVTY